MFHAQCVAFLEPSDGCWRPWDVGIRSPIYFSCPRGERLEVGVGTGTGGPELVQVRFQRSHPVAPEAELQGVRLVTCKLHLGFSDGLSGGGPAWGLACVLSLSLSHPALASGLPVPPCSCSIMVMVLKPKTGSCGLIRDIFMYVCVSSIHC